MMSIAQKIKVLIVDDQVTSRLLLGDALQQLGFTQITVAGDGEQGAKEAGKMRAEGKGYVVNDGDVLHFLFNG